MWWVMMWILLLVGSGVYLVMRLWGLWGQTKELGSELAAAQDRLDAVQGQLEHLGERIGSPEELAVFAHPASARKDRDRFKVDGGRARQQRRASAARRGARPVD